MSGNAGEDSTTRRHALFLGCLIVTAFLLPSVVLLERSRTDNAREGSTVELQLSSDQDGGISAVYAGTTIDVTANIRYETPYGEAYALCKGRIEPRDGVRRRTDGRTTADLLRISIGGEELCLVKGASVTVKGLRVEAITLGGARVCQMGPQEDINSPKTFDDPTQCPEVSTLRVSRSGFSWSSIVIMIASLVLGATISVIIEHARFLRLRRGTSPHHQ